VRNTNFFFNFLLSFLIISFVSCNRGVEKTPATIIPPHTMTEIIVDIQLMEAAMLTIQQNSLDIDNSRNILLNHIFLKYDISKNDFDNSMEFYTKNLDLLDPIYSEVITTLSQKQSQILVN